MTSLFQATIAALEDDRTNSNNYGLIGANLFRGGERASNDTIFLVLYFDNVDGLQKFARSPVHKQAYRWLNENRRRYPHLSAFHETFCVPAGCFETLYINTAPILLGNTRSLTVRETLETCG
ncbi:hypothetical protein F503_04289 [Ophiostoma piceae UAMH 11346]|uniref:Uncharacterized protein n=1 Tax=Ophiostoma piceae (strain UAMH 11346) TaxID=1262450 RepID=S3C7E1_OPHP1|nr:hypothetical protein F503_04289 [Ophiostoma piceae UAMH 11346]